MENQEYYQTCYSNTQFTPEKRLSDAKNGDNFVVDDLLDFPNDENMGAADEGGIETGITGTSADTSCNSPFSASSTADPHFQHTADIGGPRSLTDGQFSGELCVPYDDLAELEWLSNIVEESFSTEDLQKLQLIQGMKARTGTEPSNTHHQYHFQPDPTRQSPMPRSDMSVPAKARSKRSRAASGNWTSRLLVVSTPPNPPAPTAMSSSSESVITTTKKTVPKKKEAVGPDHSSSGGDGRKCLHCATDKTPQWRTGPMGPKTLCNACGVRYKSGRLVAEYRPASSPTFVLTKHSNSHRKVLELRRQKDMQRVHQHQQQQFMHHHHQNNNNMMFDHVSNNGDDYLIHQHIGPDYRQLI